MSQPASPRGDLRRLALVVAVAAFVLAAIGAGALAGAGAALWVMDARGAEAPLSTAALRAQRTASGEGPLLVREDDLLLGAVRATRPAVVTIWNLQHVRRTLFSPVKLEPAISGSGVIFDERGYIATNAHVIQNARALEVVLVDGRRLSAEVVGQDLDYDVAVLRLPEATELPAVASLADSSRLEPGMRVLAIGSPLGTDYQNTVTNGIIAGLNRRVKGETFDLRTLRVREYDINAAPLIQTDAAINTGNSGGPLVDIEGRVVGLNTLVVRRDEAAAEVEGLGFAVPSNVIRALADEWVDGRSRGWLGTEWETVDPSLARELGLSQGRGAILRSLVVGGAAERAGLREGDVIVAVDEIEIGLDRALADVLWRYRAGDRVRIRVERGGSPMEVDVLLDGR